MAEDQKKALLKALRISLCTKINTLSTDQISQTIENAVSLEDFISNVIEITRSKVAYPIETEKARSSVVSIIGNMKKCVTDLHENTPKGLNLGKMKGWDEQWRVQKERNKRACNIDTQHQISKKIRAEQAVRAIPIEDRDILAKGPPADYLSTTLRNCECTLSLGIPHDAIQVISTIGRGSFGECNKVEIKGVSFFPRGTFYAAKKYLGDPEVRLKSFEKEISIDLMHTGIVRSIGHTYSNPWIAIFPLFNGGSISSMLSSLAYEKGTYVRVIRKLQGGGRSINRGVPPVLSEAEKCRLRCFCYNAPSLIHALVQTVAFAHAKGVVHCDLHPGNVMLDFTQDNHPRIGIIDWGLALRLGYEKRISQTPNRRDVDLRPWLAQELLGQEDEYVYTKDVDVYAISWMILQICIFCEEYCSEYEESWEEKDVSNQVQHIKFIVKEGYLRLTGRKTMADLDKRLQRMHLEPVKCLRPMMEMMPAFY